MSILNFEYEFDRFLFRGNQSEIQALYNACHNHCPDDPVCVGDDVWEVEVLWGDFEKLIAEHPLLKATGFVLNWDTRKVHVVYSESGSPELGKIREIAGFDGHNDSNFRWYASCPITAERQSCKEYYSNVGEYDRFVYSFPFAQFWNNGIYAKTVLSETERNFQISPEGVLLKCDSTEAIVRVPEGVRVIGSNAFTDGPYSSNRTVTEILLPSTVRAIEKNAFYSCDRLTAVQLPEGLESIGETAFCATAVKELSLPMSLKVLEKGFHLCGIVQVHVPEDHPVFALQNGCLFDKINHRLIRCFSKDESIVVPEDVLEIGDYAFENRDTLREITLPKGILRIGAGAFYFCRSLRRVYVPDGVTELAASTFEFCSALEHVDLPAGLTKISDSAFGYCESLNHLIIPEGVRELKFGTFAKCISLSDLTLPSTIERIDSFNMSGLVDTPWYNDQRKDTVFAIGGVLIQYKKNEAHAVIPQGIKVISSSVFAGKKKLETVDLPDGLQIIDGSAFSGCTNLKKVVCPDSVTKIFWGAFADCPSLEYLYAPNAEPVCVPIGNGKAVSDTMVAVLPNVKFADQKPAAWKMALCRGFLMHPELTGGDVQEENLAVVLKQRKKLLPWVFANDNVDALKLFLDSSKTTKAKLKSEYITPAQEAGAEKCLEYLAGVTV